MEHTALSLPPLVMPGEVITFYSYKGGTGRTMALSNIGVLLARQHNATTPVLMMDWDLEAPGLHHYFEPQPDGPGVLELFEACREQLRLRRDGGLDEMALAHAVLDAVGWEQYVCRADLGSPLYLMRAGRFDDSYSERLANLHWDQLFDSCPALFRCFADKLARHFRYVLVDSRTGRTDSAGICTTLLPRKLVVVFTPNRQSLEGVEHLVTRATAYRASHEDEQRPLIVYPLPSRIEMGDSLQRAQWRRGDSRLRISGYQPIFERLLGDCYGLAGMSLESYFDEVQLQQTRTFAYGEQLAVRLDQGGDRFSLTRTFEALLDWLAGGYCPWQSGPEIHLLAAIAEARHCLEQGGGKAVALPMARELARLGELYRRDGRLLPALQCLEESLSLRQRSLGEDHAHTLASKSLLARVLRELDKADEAQFLEECIVDTRQRTLGDEHLDTLAARASLAATLARNGEGEQGLAMQDAVLDAYRRMLGPDHLLTLGALAGQAEMLFQRGDYDVAQQLQAQVAAARERLLGAEHADTLQAKSVLARTLARRAELPAARALYEAVLQAQCRRLGSDHPQTRLARGHLDDIRLQLGEPAALHEVRQDAALDDYARRPGPAAGLHLRHEDPDDGLLLPDVERPGPRPVAVLASRLGGAPRRGAGLRTAMHQATPQASVQGGAPSGRQGERQGS